MRKVNKKRKRIDSRIVDNINAFKKKDSATKNKDIVKDEDREIISSNIKENEKKKNDVKKKKNNVIKSDDKKKDKSTVKEKEKAKGLKKDKINLKERTKKKDKDNKKIIKSSKLDRNKKKIVKNKPKRRWWKRILTVVLIFGIIGVLGVAGFFAYIVLTAPEFDESAFDVKEQTLVYDINGKVIAKLGVQNRESVTYDQLPQVLIDAIIATEDSRYFQHNGVDLPRFIKASVYQLMGRSDAGGASTLTMQMVKNGLTSNEDQGIEGIIRKFQDVYLSVFKVEKNYTKEDIIELYVNYHCLGSSIYGVEEASKYYFGKSVSELTLPEAALLAGLFQAPNRHNPYRYPESATTRRNTVLNLMVRHGYITKEEADMAKNISVESLLVGIQQEEDYQGFLDNIVDEVDRLTGMDPAIVPMKIYTTMETKIQDGINSIMRSEKKYWSDENIQAGIAIINVKTGAVAALSPARTNTGERLFNYPTEAHRQPGSTAKPIFAYGAGFEYNNYSTYTPFVDEPWSYTDGPSINNWDGGFDGFVTTRYALQYSRNIPALKSYQQIGSKKIQQFAYSLGLNVSLNQNSENYKILNKNTGLDNTINEAYSIGGTAEGFTPLEMASAYSAFASMGYYTSPYSITKIEFRDTGEVIEYKPTKTRVMKDSTAYLMNNILESAVNYGFSGGAKVNGSHVAAKTGTTNYDENTMKQYNLPYYAVNDLWTIAYTSEYVIAVWYGYDTPAKGYNVNGSGKKEALVTDVMKYIPKDTKGWKQPSSVVSVQVEKGTYPVKLASQFTPSDMILTEYFVRGTQPTEVSDRYKQLADVSDANVVVNGNTATLSWKYTTPANLTDEYLTKYFNQSVFGNSKDKLLEERKKYNTDVLGDIIFGIYRVREDETLELLGHTNELTYTYRANASGNINLMIKAEHSKYSANASIGTKIKFSIADGEFPTNNLSISLNGEESIEVAAGNYIEGGINSITYGNTDITNSNSVMVKYQLVAGDTTKDYSTVNLLVNAVNNLLAGTYKINYVVTYNDKYLIKTRTVVIK